jgi:hypothetical protein
MSDDLVKRLTDHIAVFFDDKGHVFEDEILCDEAADCIEELEAKLARSERRNEALEELRPIWAQGWTEDSMAAQASGNALSTLWAMLGAENQTQAVSTLAELKAKLEKATEEKLDAISTLDAWFDRRKLAHDAIDQAVVDAASGYLRTSRVGGMPQEESDLILGVIQDMARLSVFADLFARATLTELKGEKE